MGSLNEITLFADQEALEWARSITPFERTELVSAWPWARTLRLLHGPQQARVIEPLAALSQRFARRMPQLLAHDARRGWLLSADHGGRMLDYDAEDSDLQAIATTYATLQAEAARAPELLLGLPQPLLESLPQRLLDFLAPPAAGSASAAVAAVSVVALGAAVAADAGVTSAAAQPPRVHADYFLGAQDSADYHHLLQRRIGLIEQHLRPAAELPLTVNHGDLRPPNAAIASSGHCVLMDWDDAVMGPAGMSLHGLFSGVVVPTILLSGSAGAKAAAETPNGQLIHAYVKALVKGGYASRAALHRALPAAACAGMIQFMLNFASFPGEEGREAVADTLESRLDALLDLCDLLATRDTATALALAQDYEAQGYLKRAQYLLQDHVVRHPDDMVQTLKLGELLRQRQEIELGEHIYREALARLQSEPAAADPLRAQLHAGLGALLISALKVEDAAPELQTALRLDASLAAAQNDLQRVHAIHTMQREAAEPTRMPILALPRADADAGELRPELRSLGAKLFDQYGTLQINNAFRAEDIARVHDVFMQRYEAYFREDDHPDALRLGDKRYMLTVDIENELGDGQLIGSPMVLPIIREILGDDCVMGAYTAVISLPGSRDQRLHKDHPALFPDTPLHFSLPCFAAQIIIPLVPLNDMTGTTRFYKGSHRFGTEEAEASGAQDPVVPLGSCLLTDYRCAHRGRGNRSDAVRPILTIIFNRPWFRDFKNYSQQPPLRVSDAAFDAMPKDLQRLVAWWKEERKNDALQRSVLGH